ncbi:glycosyltransferase family 4 protein [Arthrobacter echini]|uniref:D-inositol 3-phosphate glycosyltransferase n=1 Tax=Arthrobacter echini TaxID=1529066 RepID=A0A5D0XLV9_9MICC|nr:glycosyltransferase [Arthrobacter echini]TYC97440.1 glycosyltransferase family 4 protein [Arthrobacter echini]
MGLRIAVATRIFEPETGAAAYRLAATVRQLEKRGHEVIVYTSRAPGAERSSPTVRRWPVLRDKTGAVRGYVEYASFDIPLLFRLLLGRAFDVIIVEPPPTTGLMVRIAAAIRRRPFVYFAADVSSVAAAGIGVPAPVVLLLRTLERYVLSAARYVLTVSPGVSDAVVSLTRRPERVVNVGTGVDTRKFSREGRATPEHGRYFVYAGTMSEIQGAGVFVDGFLRVMAEFPDVRLIMYGYGVERDELVDRAVPAGERISFPGTVDSEFLSSVLRGAVAGLASVRPAKGYDFAFATKAFVSLSCGTPVIYAGVGPLKDIVAGENLGLSVEWDADEVALAMRQLLTSRRSGSEKQRLAEWVEDNYSLTRVGDQVAAVVERIHGVSGN